jgi:hypothetical protein
MTHNSTFSRARNCLAHPLSLFALVVLLLNDHLFRVYWPGWWTGKLGDFAWLFFFPFALAAILSWLVPHRWRDQQWIPGLAFTLTGGAFFLAKIWAPFHSTLVVAATQLFGWHVGWRLDPTDLIALAALGGAAWLWRSVPSQPRRQPQQVWLLVGIAGFLTLANSPMPETGITCLEVADGQIYAYSTHRGYRGEAGGLVWREDEANASFPALARQDCNPFLGDLPASFLKNHPTDASIVYRVTRGESIERSLDDGQTWQIEFELLPDSEAMRAYYQFRNSGNAEYFSGPFDAEFDPSTGNLILAMGHSGVLVRQADRTYTCAGVGIHQHEEPNINQVFFILFPGELLLALIIGGLGVMFLSLQQRPFSFRHVLAGISGVVWLFITVVLPPALTYGYGQMIVMLGLAVSGILLLPLVVEVLVRAGLSSIRLLLQYVLILIVSIVLFFLPFAAWGLDVLPNYRLAQLFALAFVAGWIYWQSKAIISKSP